jgi:hypothetical protein
VYSRLAVALVATVLLPLHAQARFMQTDPVGYGDDMDMYTYVQDDPVNLIDPQGEYGQSCSATSDGSCGSGFDNAQDAAAASLRGASNALTNALNDMSTVQSKAAGGDTSAHVSADTERTVAAFNHAFGSSSDVESRMATVIRRQLVIDSCSGQHRLGWAYGRQPQHGSNSDWQSRSSDV